MYQLPQVVIERLVAQLNGTADTQARALTDQPFVAVMYGEQLVGSIPTHQRASVLQALAAAAQAMGRHELVFTQHDEQLAAIELPLWRADTLSALLAQAAQWLAQRGLAGKWRNELLDVITPSGHTIAVIERAAIRMFGFCTQATHLNLYAMRNGEPCLWLAQRSLKKANSPGEWDTVVGGLVSAGETALSALPREAFEEAGIRVLPQPSLLPRRRLFMQRAVEEGWLREYAHGHDAWCDEHFRPVNQDGEVEQFALHTVPQALERIQQGQVMREAAALMLQSLSDNQLIAPITQLQSLYA